MTQGLTGHRKPLESDMTWLKVYEDHSDNGECEEAPVVFQHIYNRNIQYRGE